MELKRIEYDLTVCKVASVPEIDRLKDFYFIGKTDDEISLVCLTGDTPDNTLAREDGWKAFRIQGILDFSMIGVLSRISTILAENGIGIFVVSTYNTDYIMVKKAHFESALELLQADGYSVC